jgi:hypothetical protein
MAERETTGEPLPPGDPVRRFADAVTLGDAERNQPYRDAFGALAEVGGS